MKLKLIKKYDTGKRDSESEGESKRVKESSKTSVEGTANGRYNCQSNTTMKREERQEGRGERK